MKLILVRHGEAKPALHGDDIKRPLSERGRRQAKETAQFIHNEMVPDIFVVSPLLRAQETLAEIQHYFPQVKVMICNKIKPEDDPKAAVEWLSQLPFEQIVVVCHMNVVAHIAEQLTHEYFHPFHLAEARVYEQSVIANGLSTQLKSFIPSV